MCVIIMFLLGDLIKPEWLCPFLGIATGLQFAENNLLFNYSVKQKKHIYEPYNLWLVSIK